MSREESFLAQPDFETNRLLLRKLKLADVQDMYEYSQDPDVCRFVTWDAHLSKQDTEQFLQAVLDQYENAFNFFWGIEWKENKKLIGTIDFVNLSFPHKKAEIGYILSKEYWGKGIMTEAAKEIIKFAFINLGLVRIEARCFKENIGSEKVMQKIGMKYEGTMRKAMFAKGKQWDVKLYAIVHDDYFNE